MPEGDSGQILDLEEIAELEAQFLAELMEEPPHGHNHGRARGQGGGWHPLETDHRDVPSYKREVVTTPHGTAYAYVKLRCRCAVCRKWQSDRMKARRATPGSEEEHA